MMVFEDPLQARGGCPAGHDGQLRNDLLFRIHQIVELGGVQVAKGNGSHNVVGIA